LICCQHLILQLIRVWCWFDPVFSFLDDRHFVIPSVLLNVYRLCLHPRSGQQWVPPPAIIRSYALSVSDIRMLRFFPDVSAAAGHFYADLSRCMFGIQIEALSLSTKWETVQEQLVPVRVLKACPRSPVYWRASVRYKLFVSPWLVYAFRAAEWKIPMGKLPAALRGVGTCRLLVGCVMRFAVVLFSCLRCVWGDLCLFCMGEHC